jgi:hypothetical protein
MIQFILTPEEAQPTALAVYRQLESTGFTIRVEESIDDAAPLRPTLVAEANELRLLIEAQGDPMYSESLRDLVKWAAINRVYGEVYIATSRDKSITMKDLDQMRREGIGLILVDDQGNVHTSEKARNPALMITPEPRLNLGPYNSEIKELVTDFNNGNRKGALQHMCELVEQETGALIVKAARKKWLNKTEEDVSSLDWSSRIDVLGSNKAYNSGRVRLVQPNLKNDLHSMRGARNLFDHPAPTRKEKRDREVQFAERMMMGPRLIEALLALKRKIK